MSTTTPSGFCLRVLDRDDRAGGAAHDWRRLLLVALAVSAATGCAVSVDPSSSVAADDSVVPSSSSSSSSSSTGSADAASAISLSSSSSSSGSTGGAPSTPTGAVDVSAAFDHTCALTAAGGALCWGANEAGQLGDGSTTDSLVPVAVAALPAGIVAITAGYRHTCAVTRTGGALCWGLNHLGQLGNGSTEDSRLPLAVSGLSSGVAALAAGWEHTCALTTAGAVLCWGGQLAKDGTTQSRVPVVVQGLSSGVVAISAGEAHSCALTAAGGVTCWGANDAGQLGDGSKVASQVPVAVTGLSSGVAAISVAGYNTCALTTAGGVLCWGRNDNGQLGNGTATESPVPVAVVGLSSGVAAISAGGVQTCALTTASGLLCWGANHWGQLGNDSTADSHLPVAVSGLSSGVAAVSAGLHTCAVTTSGAALCWGFNVFGQLGDGTKLERHTPVLIIGQ